MQEPPLTPVYPELLILPFLRSARIIAAFRQWIERGARNTTWYYGAHKSARRWGNQFENRKWTPQKVTHMIKWGTKYPAPNYVKPGNPAIRYQDDKTGQYVVRDETTREILQISGPKFEPKKFK